MNELFHELNIMNQGNPDQLRRRLIGYLKEKLVRLQGGSPEAAQAAYEIAGLAATDYGRDLKSSDPLDEILTIAGELEVNPKNKEALRRELVEKIRQL